METSQPLAPPMFAFKHRLLLVIGLVLFTMSYAVSDFGQLAKELRERRPDYETRRAEEEELKELSKRDPEAWFRRIQEKNKRSRRLLAARVWSSRAAVFMKYAGGAITIVAASLLILCYPGRGTKQTEATRFRCASCGGSCGANAKYCEQCGRNLETTAPTLS